MAKDDGRATRQSVRKSPMDSGKSKGATAAGSGVDGGGDHKGPKCTACSQLGQGDVHHHWKHCPIRVSKEDKSADIKSRAAKLTQDAEQTAANIRAARIRKGTLAPPVAPQPPVNQQPSTQQPPFAPVNQPPVAPTQQTQQQFQAGAPTQQPPFAPVAPVNQQQQFQLAAPTQQQPVNQPPVAPTQQQQPQFQAGAPTQQPPFAPVAPVNQQQQFQPVAPTQQQQQQFQAGAPTQQPVNQDPIELRQQYQASIPPFALAPAPPLEHIRYMGPPQQAYGLPPPPYGSQPAAGSTATFPSGGDVSDYADDHSTGDDTAAPNDTRIYGGWKYQATGPPTPIPGLARNMERPSKLESNTAQSKAMNQRFNAIAQKAEFMGDKVDAWIICVALPMRGMGEMRLYENDDMARDAPGVKESVRRVIFDALQGKRMQRLSELKKEAERVAEKVRVAESMARKKAKEAEKYKAQLKEARAVKVAKMQHAKTASQKRRELKRKRAVRTQVTVVDLED